MRRAVARGIGFLVPTALLVTAMHLQKLATPGEAVDGLLSGVWFALLFFAGTAFGLRFLTASRGEGEFDGKREGTYGAGIALAAWGFLWAFWAVVQPAVPGLAADGFVINSMTMAAFGLSAVLFDTWREALRVAASRRAPSSDSSDEAG